MAQLENAGGADISQCLRAALRIGVVTLASSALLNSSLLVVALGNLLSAGERAPTYHSEFVDIAIAGGAAIDSL